MDSIMIFVVRHGFYIIGPWILNFSKNVYQHFARKYLSYLEKLFIYLHVSSEEFLYIWISNMKEIKKKKINLNQTLSSSVPKSKTIKTEK